MYFSINEHLDNRERVSTKVTPKNELSTGA
jgi:hypothetical protein